MTTHTCQRLCLVSLPRISDGHCCWHIFRSHDPSASRAHFDDQSGLQPVTWLAKPDGGATKVMLRSPQPTHPLQGGQASPLSGPMFTPVTKPRVSGRGLRGVQAACMLAFNRHRSTGPVRLMDVWCRRRDRSSAGPAASWGMKSLAIRRVGCSERLIRARVWQTRASIGATFENWR